MLSFACRAGVLSPSSFLGNRYFTIFSSLLDFSSPMICCCLFSFFMIALHGRPNGSLSTSFHKSYQHFSFACLIACTKFFRLVLYATFSTSQSVWLLFLLFLWYILLHLMQFFLRSAFVCSIKILVVCCIYQVFSACKRPLF